ncbi:hypothetical protein HYC85_010392 [Camellia sinensis]|uniref:Uncharacterized protein n=1 Tax=Camellia sinensis TaxID=4442 RepID=A0A7J7HKE0_CAMSI|nr:hypothetical protein HYC85_010392 [Camellia sinensis]
MTLDRRSRSSVEAGSSVTTAATGLEVAIEGCANGSGAGMTKMKNLDENIGAVRVKLDIEYLKEISDAVPVNEVAGVRIHGIFARISYEFSDTPLPKDSK